MNISLRPALFCANSTSRVFLWQFLANNCAVCTTGPEWTFLCIDMNGRCSWGGKMSERADPHKIWELAEIPGKRFDRNAASPLPRYIDTSEFVWTLTQSPGSYENVIIQNIYDRTGEATWKVFGLLAYPHQSFSLLENYGKGRGLSNRRYCGLSVTLESPKLGQVG